MHKRIERMAARVCRLRAVGGDCQGACGNRKAGSLAGGTSFEQSDRERAGEGIPGAGSVDNAHAAGHGDTLMPVLAHMQAASVFKLYTQDSRTSCHQAPCDVNEVIAFCTAERSKRSYLGFVRCHRLDVPEHFSIY